jgi:hypothetical protein
MMMMMSLWWPGDSPPSSKSAATQEKIIILCLRQHESALNGSPRSTLYVDGNGLAFYLHQVVYGMHNMLHKSCQHSSSAFLMACAAWNNRHIGMPQQQRRQEDDYGNSPAPVCLMMDACHHLTMPCGNDN